MNEPAGLRRYADEEIARILKRVTEIQIARSALFAAAAPVAILGLSYLTARAIYRKRVEARTRFLTDLLDRIVREASSATSITPALPTSTPGR